MENCLLFWAAVEISLTLFMTGVTNALFPNWLLLLFACATTTAVTATPKFGSATTLTTTPPLTRSTILVLQRESSLWDCESIEWYFELFYFRCLLRMLFLHQVLFTVLNKTSIFNPSKYILLSENRILASSISMAYFLLIYQTIHRHLWILILNDNT